MSQLRIRHPGATPKDIYLGPSAPSRTRGRNDPWTGHTIADMSPLIAGSVLSQMSDGHGKPKAELSFSIRPENRYTLRSRRRYAPVSGKPDGQRRRHEDARRCDYFMPKAKEPCARLEGHTTEGHGKGHRTLHDMEARAERKRVKYPARQAA